MRWHNGGNEKVRIWSIFNTLFGHMERKCGERKRPMRFIYFTTRKLHFFLCCRDTFSSTMRLSFLLWEWVHFLQTFFLWITFSSVLCPNKKKMCLFFFLFHWGKRKKTQNLIESDFLVLYIINYGLKIPWMISNCNFL